MGFEKTYLWEDPIHSGIVFGSVFITLISICYYSLISVVAYVSLTALLAVLSLKVYTYVMVTFLKKEVANPLAKCAGEYLNAFSNFSCRPFCLLGNDKVEKIAIKPRKFGMY